jgi:peptide/nickel transport system permease protein
MIPTLLAVAVLVFLVLRVVPGDIVELKLTAEGGEVSLEQIEAEKNKIRIKRSSSHSIYKVYVWSS